MNFKVAKIMRAFFCALAIGLALMLNIFGETINSNVFTSEQKDNFADFKGKSVSTTANLNWQTKSGSKITKSTVKNLPSYLLTADASGEDREKVTFVSSPKEALDLSEIGRLYFVVQYASNDEKNEYTVNLSLSDGTDMLVCTAPLKGNLRQLVSFEVGFFQNRRNITELSLEFYANKDSEGEISVSGPYYITPDTTYVDELSLEDITLSSNASFEKTGIYIADSTEKNGFSGRFVRAGRGVNHLRLFISTGKVGGTMEMRYSYYNTVSGNLTTKSKKIELKNEAENCSYIIPLEYADSIISLSFLFDVAREGGVTVHRIESAELYTGNGGENFGIIDQCTYSPDDGTVTVEGEIFHAFLIKHTDFTLQCYRLEASETVDGVILAGREPVASSKMSSEFKMTYKAGRQDKLAVLSRYAIVASDGEEYIEILPPIHINKKSAPSSAATPPIKGICFEEQTSLAEMGAGLSVVDVYIDRLVGQSKSGYIYSLGATHLYFDSDYVHSIDNQVKNLCVAGCSVYLRILTEGNGDRGSFDFFSLRFGNEEARTRLFSIVDFLTSRYSDHKNGNIKGYIVGRALNLSGATEDVTVNRPDLTDHLANILEIIALSASLSMPQAKVVIPVSVDPTDSQDRDAELFLWSLSNRLREFGGPEFAVMLESSEPFYSKDLNTVDARGFNTCISRLEQTLESIAEHSAGFCDKYVYFWEPDPSVTDRQLCSVYAYMYYSFLMSGKCESFVLASGSPSDSELMELFKYIDTEKNQHGELTDFLLLELGIETLADEIPNYTEDKLSFRFFEETVDSADVSYEGKFDLFDFSSSFGTLGWFGGNGCYSLSVTSGHDEKYLCAVMNGHDGQSELSYHFDTPEDLNMAPYMNFRFSIGEGEDEKYRVKITVRSGKNAVVTEIEVLGGTEQSITVDISRIASVASVDSISISVDSAAGADDSYEVRLCCVSVLSEVLDSESLAAAVNQARSDAANPVNGEADGEEQNTPDYEFVFVLAAVLIVCVIVAGIYDRNKD